MWILDALTQLIIAEITESLIFTTNVEFHSRSRAIKVNYSVPQWKLTSEKRRNFKQQQHKIKKQVRDTPFPRNSQSGPTAFLLKKPTDTLLQKPPTGHKEFRHLPTLSPVWSHDTLVTRPAGTPKIRWLQRARCAWTFTFANIFEGPDTN